MFWILDNYTTSFAMAQDVKDYIEELSAENEKLKQKLKSKKDH